MTLNSIVKAKTTRVCLEWEISIVIVVYNMQIHLTMHLICFKYSVKLRIGRCVAMTGCQFEEWLVIVMPMGSMN